MVVVDLSLSIDDVGDDTHDLETAVGWIVTRWTCPSCDEVNESEDDLEGMDCECENCGERFIIRRS